MPHPRGEDPVKHCLNCGTQLERRTYNGRLEDRGVFQRRKYCNLRCMGDHKTKPTSAVLYRRHKKSECEMCGATGNLDVHHKDEDKSNSNPLNLMTLCDSCHTSLHWQNGKKPARSTPACIFCEQRARRWGMCEKHAIRYMKYGDPYLTKRKGPGGLNVLVRDET